MKPKTLYAILCVVGTLLPWSQFVPFLRENGLDLPLVFRELFANRISSSFALDVIVSSVVFWVFVAVEGRRAGVKRLWAPIAGNVVIGLSLGVPLVLYMRERRLEAAGR
jgi:Terpene cyclase DEP1